MITFDPPALEAGLRDAITRLGTAFGIDWEGSELDPSLDLDLREDAVLSLDTMVRLDFPSSEESANLPVKELVALALEVTG